jgi:hypothetical protein
MPVTHRIQVETTLEAAAGRHAALLPPEIRASLPRDAQGLTEAIVMVGARR